ncbi:MAG: YihA family ribosome biogenesis GTP-binding protein [Burkholderiales bacterium]|nr:YihA family ribosome biogenesis GTP-binding protein [Burkholderiales bacterium]
MTQRAIVSEKVPNPPTEPRALRGASFLIAAAALAQLPPPGPPEVAFAGRSNAGKSSAINVLAGRRRLAFASRTPGRTQQIVLFGLPSGAIVADLPGYGYAAVPKAVKREWQDVLAAYVATRSTLVGLVLVVDARHGLKPLDLALLDGFLPSGRPVAVLATKSDKLTRTEGLRAVATIRDELDARYPGRAVEVIAFSASARLGLAEADAVLAGWLAS